MPKLHTVDGRNLGYDALSNVCGIGDNPNMAGRIAAALNGSKAKGVDVGIRELVWRRILGEHPDAPDTVKAEPERFERAVESAIGIQARKYRQSMPGAALSPTALAIHWESLETYRSPGAGVTGDEARQIAEEELARIRGSG